MAERAGRVAVTGGAGFVGHHLVRELVDRADEVVVLDRLDHGVGDPELFEHPRVTLHEVDLRDRPGVRRALRGGVDHVFHLAALHYVPYCEKNPQETLDNNVGGTQALLAVLDGVPHSSVVVASSAAVYGFSEARIGEEVPPRPAGAYGKSKLLTEHLLREHAARHPGVHAAAARLFNVYGPGETNPHVIPEILACTGAGAALRLGNLWPRRDYVHVLDVAAALVLLSGLHPHRAGGAAGDPAPAGPTVVNVATGVGTTVRDLVSLVEDATGRALEVLVEPGRQRTGDGHLVGRGDRLQRSTGWSQAWSLTAGMADLLAGVPAAELAAARV